MKKMIMLCSMILSVFLSAEQKFPIPKIEFQPKHYICYKSTNPIHIDGKMDEQEWDNAVWTDSFIDIEGDSKPKPFFDTKVKMLWDDQYFYFTCELEESDIWAKLKKRDSVIFYDNDFEIFIDPNGDTHEYYEFEMNAMNTVWDLLLIKPYRDQTSVIDYWDIQGLKSSVHLEGTLNNPNDFDKKWTVEVAIPWKVLEECAGTPIPKDGEQWRVNFSRVQWETEVKNGDYEKIKGKREHNWVWSPQGLIAMHYPEMWGFVQFSKNEVGTEQANFVWNNQEDGKWQLRKLYYAMKEYYEHNKVYNFEAIDYSFESQENYKQEPIVYIGETTWEAVLYAEDRTHKITIDEEGQTKIINLEKK